MSDKIYFNGLKQYLYKNNVFGFTVSIRKNVLIYLFRRYFNGRKLTLKIKVDKKTKNVVSVINNDTVYTNFKDIKNLVEKK